jgi:tetratricopeptide (TPR) repeat protein
MRMAVGKISVAPATSTPADSLRGLLGEAELVGANLRGAGPRVVRLAHLLDQIADLLAEMEAAGVDVRAERGRNETVCRRLRRQKGRFLAEAGRAFQQERAAVAPDRARWWWFLDEELALERRQRLRQGLLWGAVLVVGCAISGLVYDRFIAPPPEVRRAYQYSTTGESFAEEGDLGTALAEFEAAIELTPDNPTLWVWKGVIHSQLDQTEQAEEAFLTARSLYGEGTGFLQDRGMTYLRLGNVDAAAADVEQIITQEPESGVGYYLRASVALARDDYQAAIDDLDRASELAQAAGDTQLEATVRVQRAMVFQMWTAQVSPSPTPTPP